MANQPKSACRGSHLHRRHVESDVADARRGDIQRDRAGFRHSTRPYRLCAWHLAFLTGGFAWTYDRLTLTRPGTGATESPFLWRLGFADGVGVEVPVAPHWTARFEYLFTNYGNSNTTFFAGAQRFNSEFFAARGSRRLGMA